jgi:hypothetical protein
MTKLTTETTAHGSRVNFRSALPYGPQVVFDADAERGAAEAAAKEAADKAAADAAAKAAADAAAKEAADKAAADAAAKAEKEAADKVAADLEAKKKAGTLSDTEAKLLKEVMEKKAEKEALEAKLKQFEGIDPAKIKALMAQAEKAEADAKEAEKKKLEQAGDFDRVKAMMAEEAKKALEAKDAEAKQTKTALDQAMATINKLTVGSAFANSAFITEKTVLTPDIAQATFGPFFDVIDGQVVAFNKPRGENERTKLVGALGENLGFEAAMQKIVESRSDKEKLLRSNLGNGASSRTNNDVTRRTTSTEKASGTGADRMLAALNNGALSQKKA